MQKIMALLLIAMSVFSSLSNGLCAAARQRTNNFLHASVNTLGNHIEDLALSQMSGLLGHDSEGNNLLMVAIQLKNKRAIEVILNDKPFVRSQVVHSNKKGETPFMLAARNDDVVLCKKLKDLGGDIEAQDRSGRTALMIAAECGAEKVGAQLLVWEANANLVDSRHRTALNYAIASRCRVLVKKLLDCYASIGRLEESGILSKESLNLVKKTSPEIRATLALHVASCCKVCNLRQLLDAGFSVDLSDERRTSLLMRAAACGNTDAVSLLLSRKAHKDAQDAEGRTALMHAIAKNQVAAVRLLLESRASLDRVDVAGCSALSLAVGLSTRNPGVENLIVGQSPTTIINALLNTIFHSRSSFAVVNLVAGTFKAVRRMMSMLMKGSRSLPLPPDAVQMAFLQALKLGNAPVCSDFLQSTPRLSSLLRNDQKFLAAGIEGGSADVVELLLRCGSSANSPLKFGWRPLMLAAELGSDEVVSVLLDHHAQPNSGRDPNFLLNRFSRSATLDEYAQWLLMFKRSPLGNAAYNGHTGVCRVLMQGGANLLDPDDGAALTFLSEVPIGIRLEFRLLAQSSVSILLAAIIHGNASTLRTVLELSEGNTVNADLSQALIAASGLNKDEICAVLLDSERGYVSDPNIPINNPWTAYIVCSGKKIPDMWPMLHADKWTALMVCVFTDAQSALRCLLDHPNIRVDEMNAAGRTALMIALQVKNRNMLTALVEKCDLDVPSPDGITALSIAAQEDLGDVCSMLLDRGADQTICDKNGRSPFYHAMTAGAVSAGEILRERFPRIIDEPDKRDYNTPLIAAAFNGQDGVVEYLLKNDAQASAKNKDGIDALEASVASDKPKVCRILVQHLYDTGVLDPKQVQTLFDEALMRNLWNICQLLISHGAVIELNSPFRSEIHMELADQHARLESFRDRHENMQALKRSVARKIPARVVTDD